MAIKALPANEIETKRGSLFPEPFASRMGDRVKRRLGEAFGLTQFGINLVDLAPGGQSALRHWHSHEDELVYMISGELVMITDAGEQVVRAGDIAGFRAGDQNAHHFINRSNASARYLEVGSRIEEDFAYYPDDDAKWIEEDGKLRLVHKDGSAY
jgi:uncharacterized cupin superfamily protein